MKSEIIRAILTGGLDIPHMGVSDMIKFSGSEPMDHKEIMNMGQVDIDVLKIKYKAAYVVMLAEEIIKRV